MATLRQSVDISSLVLPNYLGMVPKQTVPRVSLFVFQEWAVGRVTQAHCWTRL